MILNQWSSFLDTTILNRLIQVQTKSKTLKKFPVTGFARILINVIHTDRVFSCFEKNIFAKNSGKGSLTKHCKIFSPNHEFYDKIEGSFSPKEAAFRNRNLII